MRGLSQYVLGALLRGLSARQYGQVLLQAAQAVGVSRSAISREAIEASEEQLKQLQERRWDQLEILVIYIDGQCFGGHHLIGVVGVDSEGRKHIRVIECGRPRTRPPSNGRSPACAMTVCRCTASICS